MGPVGQYFVRYETDDWYIHATDPNVIKLKLWLEDQKDKFSVKNVTFGKRASIAVYVS